MLSPYSHPHEVGQAAHAWPRGAIAANLPGGAVASPTAHLTSDKGVTSLTNATRGEARGRPVRPGGLARTRIAHPRPTDAHHDRQLGHPRLGRSRARSSVCGVGQLSGAEEAAQAASSGAGIPQGRGIGLARMRPHAGMTPSATCLPRVWAAQPDGERSAGAGARLVKGRHEPGHLVGNDRPQREEG